MSCASPVFFKSLSLPLPDVHSQFFERYKSICEELSEALSSSEPLKAIDEILEDLSENMLIEILGNYPNDLVKAEAFYQWEEIGTTQGREKIQRQIDLYPDKDWCGLLALITTGHKESIRWIFSYFTPSIPIICEALKKATKEQFSILFSELEDGAIEEIFHVAVLSQDREFVRQIWEELNEDEKVNLLKIAYHRKHPSVFHRFLVLSTQKIPYLFKSLIQSACRKDPKNGWSGLIECIDKKRYSDLLWRIDTFNPSQEERCQALYHALERSCKEVQIKLEDRIQPLTIVEWGLEHQKPAMVAYAAKTYYIEGAPSFINALQKACDSDGNKDWCGLVNRVENGDVYSIKEILGNITLHPKIIYQAFVHAMQKDPETCLLFLKDLQMTLRILEEAAVNKNKKLVSYLVSSFSLNAEVHKAIQKLYNQDPQEDWCGLSDAISSDDERLLRKILCGFTHTDEMLKQVILWMITKQYLWKAGRHLLLIKEVMAKVSLSKEFVFLALREIFMSRGCLSVCCALFATKVGSGSEWIDWAIEKEDYALLFSMITCKNFTIDYDSRVKIQEKCDKEQSDVWLDISRQLRFRWTAKELEEVQEARAKPGDLGLTLAKPGSYEEWTLRDSQIVMSFIKLPKPAIFYM